MPKGIWDNIKYTLYLIQCITHMTKMRLAGRMRPFKRMNAALRKVMQKLNNI